MTIYLKTSLLKQQKNTNIRGLRAFSLKTPQKMKPDIIVVHYAEIAIKGKNRPLFERTLIENISKKIKNLLITPIF